MKTCTRCGETKPLSAFYRTSAGATTRRAACKVCARPEPTPERRSRAAAKMRLRRASDPAEFWRKRLRQYGVTPEWYADTLEAQGGGCAICGAEECSTGHRFSIDHDHRCCPGPVSCGACVRGLLCRTCNIGIGNLADSAARLRSAAEYLDRFST